MSKIAPTYAEFIERFKFAGDMAKEDVDRQLLLSSELLCVESWKDWYSEAVSLDAAHALYLWNQACSSDQGASQGTAGPATSVSAAGVSIGFAQPGWNDTSAVENWYVKTIYGQQFLNLRRTVIPLGVMAV